MRRLLLLPSPRACGVNKSTNQSGPGPALAGLTKANHSGPGPALAGCTKTNSFWPWPRACGGRGEDEIAQIDRATVVDGADLLSSCRVLSVLAVAYCRTVELSSYCRTVELPCYCRTVEIVVLSSCRATVVLSSCRTVELSRFLVYPSSTVSGAELRLPGAELRLPGAELRLLGLVPPWMKIPGIPSRHVHCPGKLRGTPVITQITLIRSFCFTKARSPAGLKTRQNPGNPTFWGCHQGAISDPDEVPMGLETAVLRRNDHVWCPGGSGQGLVFFAAKQNPLKKPPYF
eukprot:gene9633-biopygen7699